MSDRVPFYKQTIFRIAAVVIAVPVLAFAWWLGSPLLFNTEVDEPFPRAVVAEIPDDMTAEDVEKEMLDAEAEEITVGDEMPGMPESAGGADPTALAAGSIMGADSFHQGSGAATVYLLENGSRILRLEDIDVTNGPDLHVFLTPVTGVEGRDEVMPPGYLDLGELRGNIGSLNYDIPADYELPDQFTIVIYCVPFHVIFATAELG